MKTLVNLALLLSAIVGGVSGLYAQSPREHLQSMVQQLRINPNDNALRERIIKLAQQIKPPPILPDEAIKFEGRGQFRFKNAKGEQDYIDAARDYESAVVVAPWILGYYFDLCTIYEAAGKFAEAKRNCEYYLLGVWEPAQVIEAKRRIAGLEVGIERDISLIAEREQERQLQMQLDGAVFYMSGTSSRDIFIRIRTNTLEHLNKRTRLGVCLCNDERACHGPVGEEVVCGRFPRVGKRAAGKGGIYHAHMEVLFEISEDNNSITENGLNPGTRTPVPMNVYRRR